MAQNETILKKLQAGFESSHGVVVPATRKVYAQYEDSYDRGLAEFNDTTGTYAARRRAMYARAQAGFTITDIATFEDAAWWCEMFMKGGVAPVGDAGTPIAYTRDYTPSLAVDDLKSATFEFGVPDNVYVASQVMANTFTIRGDSDSDNEPGWMIESELLARDIETGAFTAALTDRDTEVILARGSKVYLDSATIGTTQMVGKMISFSVTGNLNRSMRGYMEDINSYAAGKTGRGVRAFDAQVVMSFADDTEFAQYRADSPVWRYLRIEREGSAIHDAVNKRARVDLNGYWSSISKGDRNGEIIATFGLAAYYNPTSGYDCRVEIVNDEATLV